MVARRPRRRALLLAGAVAVTSASTVGLVALHESATAEPAPESYVVVTMEDSGRPTSRGGWQLLEYGPGKSGWVGSDELNAWRRPAGALDDPDHPDGWRLPLRAEPFLDAPVTGYLAVNP